MGGYKFQTHWLKRTDNSGHEIGLWCTKCNEKENNVFCKICMKSFSYSNKGIQDILQHSGTAVHTKNASDKIQNNQLKLQTAASSANEEPSKTPLLLWSVRDTSLKAEILWVIKNVHCNMSANFCDDLGLTFQTMFPDSEIAKNFSLGSTKFRYLITEALAPYYEERLIEDVKKSHGFVLSYDETTNSEGKKELQTRLRYFSENFQEVHDSHLQTYFLGSATSKIILKHLKDSLKNLPMAKLLMLGSDGPNVNKGVWNLFNNEILNFRAKGLLNIGPCNLHVVNNSFIKALSAFGKDCSDLAIEVYYFFHNEPVRWEDFEKIQEEMKLPNHHFIKHSSTRWLTLRKSVLILEEQWPALTKYFHNFLPKKPGVNSSLFSSVRYTSIRNSLKQEDMPAQLRFVAGSAELFENFSQVFQKEEPLIHVLFENIETLILKLASRICTSESLKKFKNNNLKSEELFENENLLKLESIILDEDVRKHLEIVSKKENLIFLTKVKEHYKCACLHLIKKSSLTAYPHSSLLYSCRCLQPKRIRSHNSTKDVCKIAEQLPLQNVALTELADEWSLLKLENLPEFKKSDRIDHFWHKNVFALKNCNNDLKYPLITKVVKACLSLSHGNSDVERGFSKSKLTLTKDKTKMSERTLNARLIIYDSTKQFKGKLNLLPIADALLNKARLARQSYMQFLDDEKKTKEKKLKLKRKKKKGSSRKKKILEI